MVDNNDKGRRGFITEGDVASLLQRYEATTVLKLLQEVACFTGPKIDWNALVKRTSTGITNAREYQMLWRHLAYRDSLLPVEDDAQLMDDDSDLEYELEAFPHVNGEASVEAAAHVKVMVSSCAPSDSNIPNNSTVEAPLTLNIPNSLTCNGSQEPSEFPWSSRGINITFPVSLQKAVSSEGLGPNGSASGSMASRKKRKKWSTDEDEELIAAVKRCGEGNWAHILKGEFKGDRTASQLSQRWALIRKRCDTSSTVANQSGLQRTEAQMAANHALSLAVGNRASSRKLTTGISPTASSGNAVGAVAGGGGSSQLQVQQQSQPPAVQVLPRAAASASVAKPRVTVKKTTANSTTKADLVVTANSVAAAACMSGPSAVASVSKAEHGKNAATVSAATPSAAALVPKAEPGKNTTASVRKAEPGKNLAASVPKGEPGKNAVISVPKAAPGKNAATSVPKVEPGKSTAASVPNAELRKNVASSLPNAEPGKNAAALLQKSEPGKNAAASVPKSEPGKNVTTPMPKSDPGNKVAALVQKSDLGKNVSALVPKAEPGKYAASVPKAEPGKSTATASITGSSGGLCLVKSEPEKSLATVITQAAGPLDTPHVNNGMATSTMGSSISTKSPATTPHPEGPTSKPIQHPSSASASASTSVSSQTGSAASYPPPEFPSKPNGEQPAGNSISKLDNGQKEQTREDIPNPSAASQQNRAALINPEISVENQATKSENIGVSPSNNVLASQNVVGSVPEKAPQENIHKKERETSSSSDNGGGGQSKVANNEDDESTKASNGHGCSRSLEAATVAKISNGV